MIPDDRLRSAGIDDGEGAPASANGGEILEERRLADLGSDAAQPLLERPAGGDGDRLAGALGEGPLLLQLSDFNLKRLRRNPRSISA